jgi:hypothetical protein
MIAKISKSANLRGALTYNQDKIEESHAKIISANLIDNSIDCSMQDLLNSFEKRIQNKGKTVKNFITHISLNPAPEDRIDDYTLSEIAEEYMERMGYADHPYIVYKHEDIDRHHLHIVTTDVKRDGKLLSSSLDRYRSKEITDNLERRYNLGRSDIRLGTAKDYKPQKINHKQGKIGQQIKNVARHFMSDYDFGSISEFATALAPYNIELEQVKGEHPDGTTYKGLVYHATDKKGNRKSIPIKSSSLGKAMGEKTLQQKIDTSKNTLKNKIKYSKSKSKLRFAMRTAKSMDGLLEKLQEQGIELVLRKNENGRIYGATVIDHNEKFVANGSKLGKEFSANGFETLSQTWDVGGTPIFDEILNAFDISLGDGIHNTGGSNQLSGGRRSEQPDDETERKRKKKKKKPIVYKTSYS